MAKYVSYAQSGVSIDANDEMTERIYASVAGTFSPRVMENRDGFAGLFRLDYDERLFKKNYKNPVLVACTDGVGSKVQLASMIKKLKVRDFLRDILAGCLTKGALLVHDDIRIS